MNDSVVDSTDSTFGIRTFSFDASAGFMLNGQSMKMKGACLHHDNGPLGAVALDRAEERRVEIMKANGYNAIRASHNPPSPAFLDVCDRLGMLVIDETFDSWRTAKNPEDYHRFFDEWWKRDTDSMVLRDRNHPSIIMWSIGNEIPERAEQDGVKSAKMQADHVRELDPTRPVTAAYCDIGDSADPYFAELDVAGYNYGLDRYGMDHRRHPRRVIVATETFPATAFEYWMALLDNAHVVGDFVWTGMDYFGESGVGFTAFEGEGPQMKWPYHGSWCGDIDVCGFKKPQSYYRDILWERSRLEMAVHIPVPAGRKEWTCKWGWPNQSRSWTWTGFEGTPLKVSIYSTADEVRLTLNRRDVGTQPVSRATRFTATFDVPFEPGELTATALSGGKIVARQSFRTAGPAATIKLTADRGRIRADRNDAAFVTVEIVDKNGIVVPTATTTPIRFTLSGKGELAAVGNGNARSNISMRQPECIPFRGRCLAIVRPRGPAGVIILRAASDRLAPASIRIVTTRKEK